MEVKLKFLTKSNIEIIESFNEDEDVADTTIDTFEENECIDCDLVSETSECYEVQFGDGSLSFIDKELVIVETETETETECEYSEDALRAAQDAKADEIISKILAEESLKNTK
jgi:hypothetical protein